MKEHKEVVSIKTVVKADMKKVWDCWVSPECIKEWSQTVEEEQITDKPAPEAKDGNMGFDFSGRFDVIAPGSYIEYTLDDNRKVAIRFLEKEDGIHVHETFEADPETSTEQQKQGWQQTLNSFKKYVESR